MSKELLEIFGRNGLESQPKYFKDWQAKILIDDKEKGIQLVEIRKPESSCQYIKALFDNYRLQIYGDYGSWSFDLTWKGNVFNMPYDNPWYWHGKLTEESRKAEKEYDSDECNKDILNGVESALQRYLDEEKECKKVAKDITDFVEENTYIIASDIPKHLEEYSDYIELLAEMIHNAEDQWEWISFVRENQDDLENYYGDPCDWELWKYGEYTNNRVWIVMYLLWMASEQLKD